MTNPEFIENVAKAAGCTKKLANVVATAIFYVIETELAKGETVTWPQFGTFKVSSREQREVRNLQTGGTSISPAHRVMKFKPSDCLRKAVR